MPLVVVQPDADVVRRPERVTNHARRCGPGRSRARRPAFQDDAPSDLEKEAAARPEEVRARRQILRHVQLDRVGRQRIGITRGGVRQPSPRHRMPRQRIDVRRFRVAESVGTAVDPDAARGQTLPCPFAGGPDELGGLFMVAGPGVGSRHPEAVNRCRHRHTSSGRRVARSRSSGRGQICAVEATRRWQRRGLE